MRGVQAPVGAVQLVEGGGRPSWRRIVITLLFAIAYWAFIAKHMGGSGHSGGGGGGYGY